MLLRWKLLILLSSVSAFLAITTLIIQWTIVSPAFDRIERSEASADLSRCHEALDRDMEHMAINAQDWAAWDDAYAFVNDRNEAFIKSALVPSAFTVNNSQLMAFIRLDGKIVWAETRDPKSAEPIEIPGLLAEISKTDHPLFAPTRKNTPVRGILMTARGPMMVAAHPIVTSDNQGPVRGAVMMGRLLDARSIEELAQRTKVDATLRPVDSFTSPAEAAIFARLAAGEGEIITDDDPDVLHGYAMEKDLSGKPAMVLEAKLQRDISRAGAMSANTAIVCGLVGGVGVMIVLCSPCGSW